MDANQLARWPISTKKDDSFGAKIAEAPTRERSSLANASFRVYYSLRAGAVPFLWESAPGTPKNTAAVSPAGTVSSGTAGEAEVLPPISPPPPYLSSQMKATRSRLSWPAAAAGCVLRALRGVLCLRKGPRQPRERPTPTSSLR
jgi:hypothetical protein